MSLGGPMFERAQQGVWKSAHQKSGGHYNVFGCTKTEDGMTGLRDMFPAGVANDLNFVLFSTSGVHGMYTTIEEVEAMLDGSWPTKYPDEYKDYNDNREEGEPLYVGPDDVTFLIVHPRLCTVRYGNCRPTDVEDIAYLKRLRQTSWDVMQKIGRPEAGIE